MRIDQGTLQRLASLCRDTFESKGIFSACAYGSRVSGYAREDSDYDVLLISEGYKDGARYHRRKLDGLDVTLLAVDRELFELDVSKGALGEFLAGRILTPYQPMINGDYLWRMEVEAKTRVVREELEDLISEFGELSRGLLIKPEYFALARLRKRAKVFLPARYSYLNMLRPSLREANLQAIKRGYMKAIEDLEGEHLLVTEGGFVRPTYEFVDRILSRKTAERVVSIIEESGRALRSYLLHGKAMYLNLDILTRELALSILREIAVEAEQRTLEEPKRLLYLKTSKGLVNLSESASIEAIANKLRPDAPLTITPLGGVINEVYLVTAGDERLVAKKFTDWHGFKWFTLNLVSLGTRAFAVAGKTRLSNEYGMNRYLAEHGVLVPEMIHISLPDRLLFESYVEGRLAVDFVKECVSKKTLTSEEREDAFNLGRNMAKIHSLGVVIGDTKPENFIITSKGEVCTLDLEQAGRGGDKPWDIAEFLYYSGHYAPFSPPGGGLRQLLSCFIEGYRELGEAHALRKAASLKYSRVFSIWTPPTVIYEVMASLRKA